MSQSGDRQSKDNGYPAGRNWGWASKSLALACALVGWTLYAHREAAGAKPSPNYFSSFLFAFCLSFISCLFLFMDFKKVVVC